MKYAWILLFLTGALVGPAAGQSIKMKTGQVIEADSIRRDGNSVIATVKMGNTKGQVGYGIATIERIDFPEPPEIEAANDLLKAGDAKGASAKISPLLGVQLGFRQIPGNRWADAAVIKMRAHAAMGEYSIASAYANELAANGGNPEVAKEGRLYQAIDMVQKRNFKAAKPLLEPIINESRAASTLAPAWVAYGDCLLGLKDYRNALLAYLRVPVFYPDNKVAMPAALLGSARAYEGIEDFERAKGSLDQLLAGYAGTREANSAKDDLNRIQRQLNND